jgi:hypothetical protein
VLIPARFAFALKTPRRLGLTAPAIQLLPAIGFPLRLEWLGGAAAPFAGAFAERLRVASFLGHRELGPVGAWLSGLCVVLLGDRSAYAFVHGRLKRKKPGDSRQLNENCPARWFRSPELGSA